MMTRERFDELVRQRQSAFEQLKAAIQAVWPKYCQLKGWTDYVDRQISGFYVDELDGEDGVFVQPGSGYDDPHWVPLNVITDPDWERQADAVISQRNADAKARRIFALKDMLATLEGADGA
jgi:hypothetical protein